MKILLGSHHFFPSTGGIETVSSLLAREFVQLGHEVRVVTQTAGKGDFSFAVIRRPGLFELLRQVRWCDAFLQNNISLRTLWPLLFVRRPLFVTHQTWITGPDGRVGWAHRFKNFVLRFATSFAISRAIAGALPGPSIPIGNPYDDQVFNQPLPQPRSHELIFVGRLVSDKGVDVLIDALKILEAKPHLTIVGDGPERTALEEQAIRSNVAGQIDFVGSKTGAELAELLRQHEILVMPSRWREPFGIVALEGIACGCVVIGSAEGGLAEAIGPCGVTVPNGDAGSLAGAMAKLLADAAARDRLRQSAQEHLARFAPQKVAALYIEAINKALS